MNPDVALGQRKLKSAMQGMATQLSTAPEVLVEVEHYLADEAATLALGARLAAALEGPLTVFLAGNLGYGKTCLCRGVLRALRYQGAVKSPTYTLVEEYPDLDTEVLHFDLYRLGDPDELEFMGIRDYFMRPALRLIEWPERGAGVLPQPDLELVLALQGSGRQARIRALTPEGSKVAECMFPHD